MLLRGGGIKRLLAVFNSPVGYTTQGKLVVAFIHETPYQQHVLSSIRAVLPTRLFTNRKIAILLIRRITVVNR